MTTVEYPLFHELERAPKERWITTARREIQDPATMIMVIPAGVSPHYGKCYHVIIQEMPGQSVDQRVLADYIATERNPSPSQKDKTSDKQD